MKRVKNRTSERRRRGLTVSPPPVAPRAEATPAPKWPSLVREEPPWSARVREREAEAGEGMKGGDWLDLVQCRQNPRSPLSGVTSAPQPGGEAVPRICSQKPRRQFCHAGRRESAAALYPRSLKSPRGGFGFPAAHFVVLAVRLMPQPRRLSAFAQAPRTQKPGLTPAKTPRRSRRLREAALQHYKGN